MSIALVGEKLSVEVRVEVVYTTDGMYVDAEVVNGAVVVDTVDESCVVIAGTGADVEYP